MPHRHRWPYIFLLSMWLFLSLQSAASLERFQQHHRQLHRLIGGHIRNFNQDDSELITASAGENEEKGKKSGGDDRKTLSQQVADGKYGLIQKELFKKPPKRPGIISYASNSEVPHDNIATLGGLTKNEIWLAENHLLVIKGGTYPPHDDSKQEFVDQIWQPIDDYNAPLHQVKIPKNPAVPPPFPVQLTDDGPLQILGTNSSRTLNASAETPAYALPPPPGWDGEIPPQNQYFPETGNSGGSNPTDITTGKITMRVPVSGEPPGGMPFPPTLLNGSLPPSFEHLPPGAAILPPPSIGNDTNPDLLDEDDPSIYYPPPYSFFYPKDNSSLVPPGPLVPGIILPPPPKFFAPLEEETTTTITPPIRKRPIYTKSTTKKPKTLPTRVSVVKNVSEVTVKVHTSRRPPPVHSTTKVPTTGKPKLITILPVHVDRLNRTYLPTRQKPSVTRLKPIKQDNYNRHQADFSSEIVPQQPRVNIDKMRFPGRFVTTSTTTPVPIHYGTVAPEKISIGINSLFGKTTIKPQSRPYYYEEDPAINTITTEEPRYKSNYYPEPYFLPPPKPQYIYVSGRPYESEKPKFRYIPQQNNFNFHISKLQNQISTFYTSPRTIYNRPTPKPVYQYSFEAQNFRRPSGSKAFRPSPIMDGSEDSFKPIPKYSVEIQPAIEIRPTQEPPSYQQVQQFNVEEPGYYSTERPNRYEPNVVVTPSRPVAEYSYDVTPNPIYQGYYTKPDENYFDDNTKQYFTVFGRKLVSSTTPLPPQTQHRPTSRGRYQQQFNYAKPRPPEVPSESISSPEIIKAIEITPPPSVQPNLDGERYIHYDLPGDQGAHFYFLTPQAAVERTQQQFFYDDRRRRDDKNIGGNQTGTTNK